MVLGAEELVFSPVVTMHTLEVDRYERSSLSRLCFMKETSMSLKIGMKLRCASLLLLDRVKFCAFDVPDNFLSENAHSAF